MSSFKIRVLVFLGALTIIGIFVMQGVYIYKNYNKEEGEFHRAVNIALRNTAVEIAKYNGVKLPEKGLIKMESSNIYEVNVNSPIDQAILQTFLETELDKQGITTLFEYGIYNCNTNELVFSECCLVAKADKKVTVKKNRGKKKPENYYFVVRFPEKKSFLWVEMKSIWFSTILLFIACAIFSAAIIVILRQKRYSELMRDFVNNMTHEFKTPISSIKISADVLLHHPLVEDDKRLTQYAQIIRDQNQRLNDQVEKVLQIAKMESSSFSLNREDLDLHELIKQCSSQYAFRLGDGGGSLQMRLDAHKFRIRADRFHMTNVISNLLDNAVKYSRNNPEIIIRTSNDKDKLIIEVEDKGIGIQAHDLDKLFQKFYRVPTGDVHNVKGFGIGLYYVKRICDAHEFELNLQSVYGEGTTVTITCKNSFE